MALNEDHLIAFNRGVISDLAEARADVKRVGMSAEVQMNMMPRTMGPMSLRPGLKYIGTISTPTGAVKLIPFIYSKDDTALVEITDEVVRVWVDDALITRPVVDTSIANSSFATNLTSWTASGTGAQAAVWATGGYLSLTGTGLHYAFARQTFYILSSADELLEHAINIEVAQGKVGLRMGTTTALDDIIGETYLEKGSHSIAFTPGSGVTTLYVTLFNQYENTALVASAAIAPSGVMTKSTALAPEELLDKVRYVQSGDVLFLTRGGGDYSPIKIERRGVRSWSAVEYVYEDGPFKTQNIDQTLTIAASALTGTDITLTASRDKFKADHVGTLLRLRSAGQVVSRAISNQDYVTPHIKITGSGTARNYDLSITLSGGAGSGVDLQRSLGEPGNWVTIESIVAPITRTAENDGLDNMVAYYRCKRTSASGTATITFTHLHGSIEGIVRITAVASGTSATATVLKALGGLTATADWDASAWSEANGYPSAVTLFQDRLWWAGKDKIWASVVGNYYSFDSNYVGDAGPISRSIGAGPVDEISWLCPMNQLVAGGGGAEHFCRSSTLEEPITPTNCNIREGGTYGSASVEVIKIDNVAVYVDRTNQRIMSISSGIDTIEVTEISTLTPEICWPSIKRIAVQRRPDTRIHLVRCDGTAVVIVYDKVEEVNCFVTVETKGLIEDVAVLPGSTEDDEDNVYYVVARVINGAVVRYLEKWATVREADGGTENKMADSFIEITQASSRTITGLDHLERQTVIVWGNGGYLGEYGVVGGRIVLTEEVTYAVVGLHYYGKFRSSKLGFLTQGANALAKKSRIVRVGLLLKNTHRDSLTFGTDDDHLDHLPPMEVEAEVAANYQWTDYDVDPLPVNGTFDNNTRLILRADAPYPCTVQAAVITLEKA